MGINTEEKRNHTAVRLGRGLPPHRVTRLGISPGIDAAEADTFRAVVVQDFEGVAVEDAVITTALPPRSKPLETRETPCGHS
jgi:hypothetical protein